ncbi:MAG: HIT family protein [Patescibacteria group bacterium]
MSDCIFCKIVEGELPSTKVYEDADTLAFLDINPVNPGHTLVIPKRHATDLFDAEDADWNALMKAVRVVAHAIERSLKPIGVNLAMNNRAGAGQVVFHAHVHVMPRFASDGHKLWPGRPYAKGEKEVTAEKIRAAL